MIRTISAALVAVLATAGVIGTTGTAAAAAGPAVFGCADGALLDYEVPAGVTSVRVRAEGGGDGAVVQATVAVTPGEILGVFTGCDNGAGYHWGGSGGPSKDGSCADGTPGGGSSAVLANNYATEIVEAGGGGGAGGDCAGTPGGAGGSGSRAGMNGVAGPGPEPAKAGRGGVRSNGLGDNGGPGRGRTGAGGGGGGGGCRGGTNGQGGENLAGAGGGGGSSCAGSKATDVTYGRGGTGQVVISPELLTAENGGSDVMDTNGNGRQDIGDQVDYWVTVRNDGGVPVRAVTVSARLGNKAFPLTCDGDRRLEPGESRHCTATRTLTAADVTNRGFTITSTATGTSAGGTTLTATASRTTKLNPVPGMTLTLDAAVTDTNGNGRTDAGDVVRHTATAMNTGGGILYGVTLTGGCTASALITGESESCVTTHVLTQDDVESGTLAATATATATTADGKPVAAPAATVTTALTRLAELAVTNTVTSVSDENDSGRIDSGDVLHYTVTAKNTGTLRLSDVATTLPGVTLTCDADALAPAETLTCTGTYELTAADADNGTVTHTASATATAVTGPAQSAPAPATTAIPVVATLSATVTTVVADVNENGLTDAGDELRHTAVLTNGGTVTLSDVTVDGFTCEATTIAAGGTATCTSTYVVTQEDVDKNAPVTVSVTAQGKTPAGVAVTSAPATSDTEVNSVPELTVTTRAAIDGKQVAYTAAVTNTGTVTLHDVSTLDCTVAVLAPGESLTCAGADPITQADIDRGFVMTVAGANGTTPWGEQVSADPSTATTKIAQHPALTVANAVDVDGSALKYTVTTTNTGDVTLKDVVATLTPARLTCAPVTLAPGESVTCEATHWATGTVTATAKATGVTPSGDRITSAPATITTRITAPAPAGTVAPSGGLASTGLTAVTEMIIAGVVVLAVGLGLLLFARRRRDNQ